MVHSQDKGKIKIKIWRRQFHCELKSQFDIRLSLVSLQHIHALLNHSDPGRDYFVPNSNTVYEGSRAGL